MLHWVTDLIDNYGYAIVVVLVLAEGVGLPLPGETALITAAAFSAQSHRLSIVGVIIASFVGATAGGLGGYWIGKWGGLPFLTSHGHMIGFTNERIAKARKFFTEHGPKAVFLARFIAIVRMLAGFLAGVTNMRFEVFFLWNALGALAWSERTPRRPRNRGSAHIDALTPPVISRSGFVLDSSIERRCP
jgi:membrane protein DedA with SNARE-associated domain